METNLLDPSIPGAHDQLLSFVVLLTIDRKERGKNQHQATLRLLKPTEQLDSRPRDQRWPRPSPSSASSCPR